jgi:D-alanyl-D-alanine carboxypeptidase
MRATFATLAYLLIALPAMAASPGDALEAALQIDVARYLAARAAPEHICVVSVSVGLHGATTPIDVVSGTRAFDGKVPATVRDLFQIGSQTKAFTSVVMLQLEAEGGLRLDQTVGEFLPQYKAWSGATIRSLLNMTSGIPEFGDNPHFLQVLAADPRRAWTVPELIAFAEPGTPGAPPPTHHWHYSNTNYLLAQLIVEHVTGHTLQAEIERRLLGPRHGLTDTFYSPRTYPPAVTDRMVSGYFWNRAPDNKPLAPLLGHDMKEDGVSMYQGAGGMVSRPEDIVRWVRALYQGTVLAPPQRAELMDTVSMRTGLPIARPTRTDVTIFGLGVGAFDWPPGGLGWYYLGETLGYRSFYAWFPRSDTVIAVSLNSQPSPEDGQSLRGLVEALLTTLHRAGKL